MAESSIETNLIPPSFLAINFIKPDPYAPIAKSTLPAIRNFQLGTRAATGTFFVSLIVKPPVANAVFIISLNKGAALNPVGALDPFRSATD